MTISSAELYTAVVGTRAESPPLDRRVETRFAVLVCWRREGAVCDEY